MFNDKPTVEDLLRKIEKEPHLRTLELDQLFFILLVEKMVSYNDISQAYVKFLERCDHESKSKIVEATTRLYQQFNPRMKDRPDVINSALYILNKCGNLVYGDLNEKYAYDEKKGEEDFECMYGFKL